MKVFENNSAHSTDTRHLAQRFASVFLNYFSIACPGHDHAFLSSSEYCGNVCQSFDQGRIVGCDGIFGRRRTDPNRGPYIVS